MKFKLIIVALVLLLVAGIIGYKMWNKPHEDIGSADSFMTISSTDLLKFFKDNETDANAKYLNQVLTVKGVIREIKKAQDLPTVDLETEDDLAAVICNFDPFSKHDALDFNVGDEISIKGKCSGMLNDVIMDRCVLVK